MAFNGVDDNTNVFRQAQEPSLGNSNCYNIDHLCRGYKMVNDALSTMLVNQLGMGGGNGAFREMVSNHTDGVQSTIIGRTQGIMEENVSSYISASRNDIHQNITMMDSIRGYSDPMHSGIEMSPSASGNLIQTSPMYSSLAPTMLSPGSNLGATQNFGNPTPPVTKSEPRQIESQSKELRSSPVGNVADSLERKTPDRPLMSPDHTESLITPSGHISSGTSNPQEELEKLKNRLNNRTSVAVGQKDSVLPDSSKIDPPAPNQPTIVVKKEKPTNAQGLPYIAGSRENIYQHGFAGGGNANATEEDDEQKKFAKKVLSRQPSHQAQVVSILNSQPMKPATGPNRNTEPLSAANQVKDKLKNLSNEDFVQLVEKIAKKAEEALLPEDKAKENAKMTLLKSEAVRRFG